MEALREELRTLHAKRARGDVTEKAFQRTLAERTVALYRAGVSSRLAPGEAILAEHHAVHGHLRLTQSVLKEPDQGAVSLFATDRRLVRLTSTLLAGESPTCDGRDDTAIDDVAYQDVRAVRMRRQVRTGEVAAGAVICAVALLGGPLLAVTGKLLLLLGALGVLHGLLLPTRWWEVEASGRPPEKWMRIFAVRKRSARELVRLLRARAGGIRA
jgi:hypothetical protein